MICQSCKASISDDATECMTCGEGFGDATNVLRAQPADGDRTGILNGDNDATFLMPPGNSDTTNVWADPSDNTGVLVASPDALNHLSSGLSTFMLPAEPGASATSLTPGMLLAGRYKIIRSLGEGGMGSVYEAQDSEVDRRVAIKVIRPELASDAQILERFKQELILARQVTHRNVVRIYDLGASGGLKFISMEFIEGRELGTLLDETGRLLPKQAAEIMLQVCRGLEASHAEGVIHRDLKPQNIMIDAQGRAAVMDFGIAYSVGSGAETGATAGTASKPDAGLTVVGSLLGTPRYMSPEQARSEPVDARSDLFTVGLIFYQLLTGVVPFAAKTRKETLRKRIEEPARPVVELNPAVAKALNHVVMKCLEKEREKRYQTAAELITDLEIYLGIRKTAHPGRMRWLAASLTLLLAGAGGFIVWNELRIQANKPHPLVKVLLANFKNTTGQAVFDGSLEPIMRDALERASFVTVYSSASAKKVAAQLRPGSMAMDESLARLVALREGIGVVVSGGIEKRSGGYRLWVKELNPSKGQTELSKDIAVSDVKQIPQAIEKLGTSVRRSLGDVKGTPKSIAEETFSTASLEAAHQYSQAQDLQQAGKWDQAITTYRQAIQLDPSFSRAYSGLAVTLANLGQHEQAEHYYKLALAYIDRESDREKFRTRGGYYLLVRDYAKATEQYRSLVTQYPADSVGLSNLALAYFYARNMSGAMSEAEKAAEIYPDNLVILHNLGLYAMYAGDFSRAISEFEIILKKNPAFEKVYAHLAMAYLANGQEAKAVATYTALSQRSKYGASESTLGLADLNVYNGNLSAAVLLLRKGIQQDLANIDKPAAATKLVALAGLEMERKQRKAAVEDAVKALELSDDERVLYPAAHVFVESGETEKAQQTADKLASHFEPEPRALGKLIDGELLLKRGRYPDAISSFQDAQKLADSWLGRFDMGLTYLLASHYPDADNEFDVCIKRRGEATAVFLDDEPTLRYLPPIYYYQGRAREGLRSHSADEFYKTFLTIKHGNESDPLVADAKRRLMVSIK
jgi:tetratricopeptide (TPR) repeat protein/predicted Ser/Thr protein kinase